LTSPFIVEDVAESAYGNDDPRQYRASETLQDRVDIPLQAVRCCCISQNLSDRRARLKCPTTKDDADGKHAASDKIALHIASPRHGRTLSSSPGAFI
jgi:hypothetical protein